MNHKDQENSFLQDKLIELPKIFDERGNLSFIEALSHVPFSIARAYWIYDVPGGEVRGSHAFQAQEEFIVALSGSFDVVLDDGEQQRSYALNRSYKGVYVPRMTWRTLENFSTNSLCLVLSSTPYDEDDYLWDYAAFKQLRSVFTAEKQDYSCLKTYSCFDAMSPETMTINDCRVLDLPQDTHFRQGNLTALNNEVEIPFCIQRVFYLYDIPSGATRGGHAHRHDTQLIVAASSCFEVTLFDGKQEKTVRLDQPNQGLLVPPGIWCQLHRFSSAAICMTFTAEKYNEADYIRDAAVFKKFKS